jgi:YegS/Rv2252/BmrU family lipid kinase
MQRRLLFLLNPRAVVQSGKPLTEIIRQKCVAYKFEFEIHNSNADGDYEWLRKKITEESFTDVIIAGGDGTISTIASSILDLNIKIGIIPRGSGNGLALAAGISKNPYKALDIIFQGNASLVDAFLINNQFSCMLSGIGFDAQVAHDFDKQQKRGFWKYTQLTVKNLFGIKSYPFKIYSPVNNLQVQAYFVSVANSNQFGNHFTIAPKASLSDGLLDVVVVEKANFFLLLLRVVWHIRFGTFTQNLKKRFGITYFQTDVVTIENPEKAPFHIDGDGKQTSDLFQIQIIPNAYRLLMP